MSHIDDLLDRLCPAGVPFRPLGEIADLVRGNGMPKSDFTESGVGCIHYGQIYTYYGVWAKQTISFISHEKAASLAKVDPADLIITNTSENIEDVCKAVAWLGDSQIVTGGHATVIKHQQDPKYLSYYFRTPEFSAQKRKHATGTKVIDVSAKSLAKMLIPVPPVEIQREIVRVLDAFTELEARRRQYAYYRRVMLNRVDAESTTLASLGKWQGGITPSKGDSRFWTDGDIPWLASMDISDESTDEIRGRVTEVALRETSLKVVQAPSVAVVMRSNILRRRLPIGLVKIDTTVNQDIRALVPRDGVDAEYVYQVLRADSDEIRSQCVRTDGSMAAVSSRDFFAWEIPLPALEEQGRIAAELRSFDALVNDLSSGLPAEIAARRKQYEYYRDRLLTFEEAA